ncbi:SMI1/KNR4 family protein [Pseudomonas brassicae]|uniref:SMI1/KNR4 family protein n=1 Tax=Pseudomonas brassicae TaxID=2708063 RepID=UPI0015B68914
MNEYQGLLLEDTREPASDHDIAQLEARLGARLPDDYRHFLKTCNGAQLEYDVDVVMASGERELLGFSLFGVGEDEHWECNPEEFEQARRRPGYPATGLLPIGRDGGASLLLLDLREGRQAVAAMVAALPAWTGRASRRMSMWCWRTRSLRTWRCCTWRTTPLPAISTRSLSSKAVSRLPWPGSTLATRPGASVIANAGTRG